jgi:hypothetical protein
VKLGKDGNPFPDVTIDTIEPLHFDLPAELQPTKPLLERAEASKNAPKPTKQPQHAPHPSNMVTDPRISWSAFWEFARPYGFNTNKDIDQVLKRDTDALGVAELYELVSAHVGHKEATA